jgi:hypothetical protein
MVTRFKGRERICKTGFRKINKSVSAKPPIKKVNNPPLTLTPGKT